MASADKDFGPVFDRLKGVLTPYAPKMHASADDDTWYGLDLAPQEERNPTTWFGAVRRGKRYVSIYLMPVYVDPSLPDDASPDLIQERAPRARQLMEQLDVPRFRPCRRPCRLRHVRPVSWVARILPREAGCVKGGGVRASKGRWRSAGEALESASAVPALFQRCSSPLNALPTHRTRPINRLVLEANAGNLVPRHLDDSRSRRV
mgnify:CR=1 FL=1